MPGRLAVDFGTSNTVVAVWDEALGEGVPWHVPELGQWTNAASPNAGLLDKAKETISVVPSLIHYTADNRTWLGQQVRNRNLVHSESSFRWMKRYIANRSPVTRRVHGRQVSHVQAGSDFLRFVLATAAAEFGLKADDEIALTVPVEAYEHYDDWLAEVAKAAGIERYRLIDEASAAALGYGAHIQPGHVYLVFDFGGGTLDVSVVLIEDSLTAATGRRCRVLGKAGVDLGGSTIDQWLFEDTLRQSDRHDSDDDVRAISRQLLCECELAKEALSQRQQADVTVLNPQTGAIVVTAEWTRSQFEELLDQHEALAQIDQTIRRALNDAREKGYTEEQVRHVLLVGGSSLIPCVQRTVQRIFGKEKVLLNRPLDAVARGAAAFIAGVDFYDHIQHDYALRHRDSKTGEESFHTIVRRGTPYPAEEPVAKLTIKGSFDGQEQLGLAIFELGQSRRHSHSGRPIELVFDPSGAARITTVSFDDEDRRSHFWLNENSPTFLKADPPTQKGQPRFLVEFSVDGNKRLLITVRDILANRLIHRDLPVVKLT